jgi:pimeloyl-ACP methyl ester carboxylesterase
MMNPMNEKLRKLKVDYKGEHYTLSIKLRPGSDDPIVFLHGWGGSKDCFAGAFLSDALNGYGICTIDLIGFGKSEKSVDFSYDLLDQASIVATAINSLNAKKVYLVGHSMGGSIGLLAAPQVKGLAIFINAESNLAPNGSGADSRAIAKRPFWLFKSSTLPLLKLLLRLHPRRSMRVWAQWFDKANPFGLYRSAQSLVRGLTAVNYFHGSPHCRIKPTCIVRTANVEKMLCRGWINQLFLKSLLVVMHS